MDASFLLRVIDSLFRDQTTSTSVLPYSRLDILHTSYFNLYIYIYIYTAFISLLANANMLLTPSQVSVMISSAIGM